MTDPTEPDDLGICPVCGSTDRDRRPPLENLFTDAPLVAVRAIAQHSMASELQQGIADGTVSTRVVVDGATGTAIISAVHLGDGSAVPLGTYTADGTFHRAGPPPDR